MIDNLVSLHYLGFIVAQLSDDNATKIPEMTQPYIKRLSRKIFIKSIKVE